MMFEHPAHLHSALNRRFRTGIKTQDHAVAGGDLNQPTRGIGFLKLLGRPNDFCQLIDSRVLFVDGKLRIANDVDEKDVRDLERDFLFNFGGHAGDCRGLGAKPLHHSFVPDQSAKAIERGRAFTDKLERQHTPKRKRPRR